MNCLKCDGRTRAYDSRTRDGVRWRRRECEVCGHRFSTYEVPEGHFTPLWQDQVIVESLKGIQTSIQELLDFRSTGFSTEGIEAIFKKISRQGDDAE